jgi:hypothetical protein
LTLLAGVQQAGAVCKQSDIAGTWASYIVGAGPTADYWLHCTLKISSVGTFTPTGSICIASTGLTASAEGSLKLANAEFCSYKGVIELTKGTAENFVNHATLAIDKNSAEGIGTFEGGGFSFNLVRIK